MKKFFTLISMALVAMSITLRQRAGMLTMRMVH